MDMQSLKVTTREESGKGASRRTRRAGCVPAVVYGLGQETVRLKVDARTLDQLLHGKQGEHAIVELEIEDKPELSGPAMIKEVQHHPVRGHVVHADLLRIDLSKKIQTMVPIKLVGQAMGVVEGGVIDHQARDVEVVCFALDVPELIEIDITELQIGDSLHVSDLIFPDNVEVITPADRSVAAVHAPRVIVEEVPEEELVEGEAVEGEEGEEEKPAGEEGADGKSGEKSEK